MTTLGFFAPDLLKMFLTIGGALLVTFIILGLGGYVFMRLIVLFINSKRDTWEETASQLGYQIDRTSPHIVKPLDGFENNFKVKVLSFAVPTGENSVIYCISCEAFFAAPLTLTFEIKTNAFFKGLASRLFGGEDVEVGLAAFDNAFSVESLNPDLIQNMLVVEMLDGKSPNLITDLIGVKKKRETIKVTNSSVLVSTRAEPNDVTRIRSIISDTVYLAERFQAAKDRIAPS